MCVTRTCRRCKGRYKRLKNTTTMCKQCRKEILQETRARAKTKNKEVGNGLFPFLDELDGMIQC